MRIVGLSLVTAVGVFCALLLAVRFVLYPQVESHRQDIAAMLSRELKATVEIDTIQTGWHGWNPEFVVRGFRIREGQDRPALLELPEVTGIVSWTSLLLADLRLRELVIDKPRLSLRRDVQGRLHVGGLAFDETEPASSAASTDWLLRQRLVVIRDADLVWTDELREAPPLELDRVDFRLEHRFGRHRFGLRGTPPAEIAAPIDVRGEVQNASFADWRQASGRLYVRLDYADVAAWSRWIPVPVDVQSGHGAMRMWFSFDQGTANDVVADVELALVSARIEPDLPALELAHVAGRVTWQQKGTQRVFATRGLELLERAGIAVMPLDVDLRYDVAADGSTSSGRMKASPLDLAPLVALARHLPLPANVRSGLERHAPQGRVTDGEYTWQGAFRAPTSFRTRGTFAALGARPVEDYPGFSGWSGQFEASDAGGTVTLATRNAQLTLPRVLPEPVAVDSAGGRVKWERAKERTSVRVEELQFANAHVTGTAQGTWRSGAKGPGDIDITAKVSRADPTQVHRYLPLVIGADTRTWLRESLRGGVVDDARLVLNGDLARFPFADGKGGTFVVTVNGRNASLDYANGWPALSAVDAQVRFEGQSMLLTATRGTVLGATLGRTTASIPDLSLEHPLLVVDGEASGPTSEFLQFIRKSPVADWIDHYTDDASAAGNGRLALKFEFPLGHPDAPPKVAGEYQLIDNALRLPGAPAMAAVNGKLVFTERHLEGRDVAIEALGGPARVSIDSADGVMKVKASGHATTAAVVRELEAPYADRVSGDADWQLALDVRNGFASWTVDSSLRGVAINLPLPVAKKAADAVPLRVERRALNKEATRDAIIVDYGSIGRVVAHRALEPGGTSVDRVLILLGKAAQQANAAPDRSGIVIRGNVEAVNVDEWLAIADSKPATGTTPKPSTLELDTVELQAGEFVAIGRRFEAMTVNARRAAQRWRLRFDSRQIEGTADWEPAGSKLANGRLSAQLAKLDYIAMRHSGVAEPRADSPRREGSANTWPELDIRAERFVGRGGNLGRMELVARPEGTDWHVTRFALINDGGRVDADGTWRLIGRQQQTRFDVTVTTTNTSAFLTHMGLPGDVKGGSAKLAGQLGWPGAPTDFDYDILAGSFRVDVGAGQFTKMDPGVGKLLGVLSLQALPRRISLDFRDVFSEGFAFDTIAGNVRIANGVMHTDDLLVSGPAAKVMLAGSVNLSKETQQLSVRVQPSLSSVVSTGAGAAAVALLAANPLVGAAVGAGTLLAQKIMKDPIEQMFSYEYAVRGSWSDPVVERVSRIASEAAPQEKAAATEK